MPDGCIRKRESTNKKKSVNPHARTPDWQFMPAKNDKQKKNPQTQHEASAKWITSQKPRQTRKKIHRFPHENKPGRYTASKAPTDRKISRSPRGSIDLVDITAKE